MNPVSELIALFAADKPDGAGRSARARGFREFARKIGERHASTVQTWEKAGSIPHFRKHQIRGAAAECGVAIPDDLWNRLFPGNAEAA